MATPLAARNDLIELEDDYRALHAGAGRWRHTPEGAAARDLTTAKDRFDRTRRQAEDPNIRRRDRRAAAKAIPELESSLVQAEHRWQTVGEPVADRILDVARDARRAIDRLEAGMLTQRLDHLQRPTPERTPAETSASRCERPRTSEGLQRTGVASSTYDSGCAAGWAPVA